MPPVATLAAPVRTPLDEPMVAVLPGEQLQVPPAKEVVIVVLSPGQTLSAPETDGKGYTVASVVL